MASLGDMASIAPGTANASVVQLAADGDETAFARIAATYHAEMVRVGYVICGDWSLAQDAAESALWIAWRKLPSLRDPERLRPWLLSVAANEARQLVRRQHRRAVIELKVRPLEPSDPDPSDEIDRLDLANALHRLSPEDRTILALRYVADLDSGQISPLVGLSASGVRSRLARLIERLRKDLTDA
jgi:RNA polymerase sigma-70 factor, ECF subfamily